jgi:hypothetical protein
MRTSLTEIQKIESYLQHNASTEDTLLLEARLLTDPALRDDVEAQREAYTLIHRYGRQQVKQAIAAADRQLFSQKKHRGFRQRIFNIFLKP